jgi:hypothetical protein
MTDEVQEAPEEVTEPASTPEEPVAEEVTPEPEATAEPEPAVDWNDYLSSEDHTPPEPQPRPADEDRVTTYDEDLANVRQAATSEAVAVAYGAIQNATKLEAILKDQPEPVRQFATKELEKLPYQIRAQKGVAESLADMAIGRAVRMGKFNPQRQAKPVAKSETPAPAPAVRADSGVEAELDQWTDRLVAAGMKRDEAREYLIQQGGLG